VYAARMTRLLLVAAGGALGASARWGAGVLAQRLAPGAAWPWATFGVNVLGGLLMGLLVGWLAARSTGGDAVRLFAAVGVLGGFTTFSAFSMETALMIERKHLGLAAGYVAASVVFSVASLFLGLMIARRAFA
jgi:fluoride exporter